MASTVSLEPEPVPSVRARRIGLCFIEIAGDNQIQLAVAVNVVDNDSLDRRDLREVGKIRRRKGAIASVVKEYARKGVCLVVHRVVDLVRTEHLLNRCVRE